MGVTLLFFLQAMVYSGRQMFLAEPVTLNKRVNAVCILLLPAPGCATSWLRVRRLTKAHNQV